METLKRFFSGLMWAAWLFLAGLMFSLSAEFNPGYGISDGVIVPALGWLFSLFSAISFIRWIIEFIQDRKKAKGNV
jgi:hypothetical protein